MKPPEKQPVEEVKELTREEYDKLSLDEQDEYANRINREYFRKLAKRGAQILEDYEKNPQNYYVW